MSVVGVISRVSQKEGKYGIMIGETWYNGFGIAPGQKGETIEFEFKTSDKGFHNVTKVIKVQDTREEPQNAGEVIGESAKKKRCSEMMRCAVDVCLARNVTDDVDIMGQFKRFMRAIGEEIPEQKVESKIADEDIPYPAGHNWEGMTPKQVNMAYARIEAEKKAKAGDPKLVNTVQNL